MSDLREAAVTFLATIVAPVLIIALAVFALVTACTLHVVVEQRPNFAHGLTATQDAGAGIPSLYGLPMGDGGPCSLLMTTSTYGSADPCAAATYSPDAALTRQANCENAGDVFEDCQK